jgi:stage IV sporulation protein B
MKKIARQICISFLLVWMLTAFAFAISLIPVGQAAGIQIATQGAMVVQLSGVSDGSKEYHPATDCGLQKGDMICSLNGKKITSNEDLQTALAESRGKEVSLTYLRNGKEQKTKVKPVKDENGIYRLGLLVRDQMAGIGTITYINPADGSYGSLGHGICDADTGALIPIREGYVTKTEITGVQKGKSGEPGELQGNLKENLQGNIQKNTEEGIFGVWYPDAGCQTQKPVETAQRKDVKLGAITILSNVDGTGPQKYTGEITQIFPENDKEGRSFMIKITDPKLIQKTGGIVQGMSGSPILQNGKLIGAVTHVLVNDPTKGYGIFVEKMLESAA